MINVLFTDGKQLLRIVKYVHPTPSIDGYFILSRNGKGCEVTLDELLTNWKVFNAHAAFADYLLYTDELLMDYHKTEDSSTVNHMMAWAKGRCLEVGKICATEIKRSDLLGYF